MGTKMDDFQAYTEDGQPIIGLDEAPEIGEDRTPYLMFGDIPVYEEEVEGFLAGLAKSLKPCPLCGSKDLHIMDGWPHHISCNRCHTRMPAGDHLENAVYRWDHEGKELDDEDRDC